MHKFEEFTVGTIVELEGVRGEVVKTTDICMYIKFEDTLKLMPCFDCLSFHIDERMNFHYKYSELGIIEEGDTDCNLEAVEYLTVLLKKQDIGFNEFRKIINDI